MGGEPLICTNCGALIGIADSLYVANASSRGQKIVTRLPRNCLGGKHAAPLVSRQVRFFGWLTRVRIFYPETVTSAVYYVYNGPRNGPAIWLAIHKGTRGRGWDFLFSILHLGYGRSYPPKEVFVDGLWVFPKGLLGLEFRLSGLEKEILES